MSTSKRSPSVRKIIAAMESGGIARVKALQGLTLWSLRRAYNTLLKANLHVMAKQIDGLREQLWPRMTRGRGQPDWGETREYKITAVKDLTSERLMLRILPGPGAVEGEIGRAMYGVLDQKVIDSGRFIFVGFKKGK